MTEQEKLDNIISMVKEKHQLTDDQETQIRMFLSYPPEPFCITMPKGLGRRVMLEQQIKNDMMYPDKVQRILPVPRSCQATMRIREEDSQREIYRKLIDEYCGFKPRVITFNELISQSKHTL